jgi:undecaprenyl-diphosphatase
MNYIHAAIYGVLQGVAEFLPISSSGHLALFPHFMKFQDPGVLFDFTLHVATALSLTIYFRSDIKYLIKEFFAALNWKKIKIKIPEDVVEQEIESSKQNVHFKKISFVPFFYAIVASIFLIVLLRPLSEVYGRSPNAIAFNLFFWGWLLYLADRKKTRPGEDFGLSKGNKSSQKKAIVIGLAQALAIFPGVSRSGITMTTGRFLNLSKIDASHFSFILSLPIIYAGMIFKIPAFFTEDILFEWDACAIAFIFSFVSGYITIHYFFKLISKIKFIYFAIYRSLLAALVLLLAN